MTFSAKCDYQYKILFLGNTNVGKTALLSRYINDSFVEKGLPTLGVDVEFKYVKLEGKKIKLDLWDTAGEERFKNITKNYYSGANGIIFVCDVTSKDSLEKLKYWIKEAKDNSSADVEMILVGNKIDLTSERELDLQALKDFGSKYNIDVYEASAKTGKGVEEFFMELTKTLFKNKEIGKVEAGSEEFVKRKQSHRLTIDKAKEKPGCKC